MGTPVGDWHETNTQVNLLFPRVEQADGSNRTGLTLTDFYVQLRDQADNIEYQKAEGNPTPSVNNIAVTCDEVGEGRYVFAFTPDADGLWKLDVQYSTDGYKADGGVEAVPNPLTVYVSD